MYVVQHNEFDEMVEEMSLVVLPTGARRIIRVLAGEVYLRTGQVSRICVGVHIRTIDYERNTVLSCLIATGYFNAINGEPFGPDDQKKKARAWRKAYALREDVKLYLEDRFRGCLVNGGIIHLGEVFWQPGDWSKLQDESMSAEPEEE